MSKRKTAEDNISVAVAVLQTTRAALFFGAKSLEGARKDKRIGARMGDLRRDQSRSRWTMTPDWMKHAAEKALAGEGYEPGSTITPPPPLRAWRGPTRSTKSMVLFLTREDLSHDQKCGPLPTRSAACSTPT